MIYFIDIDGTICFTPRVDGVHLYDSCKPYPSRIKTINRKFDEGHTIIYWTARGMSTGTDWSELTKKQLDDWGCKYTELRMNKPSYDVWVDDKSFNAGDFFND